MTIVRIIVILLLLALPNVTIGEKISIEANASQDVATQDARETQVIATRSVRLDQQTVKRGITLSVDNGSTLVAVVPGMLKNPATVTIEKRLVEETYEAPRGLELSQALITVRFEGEDLVIQKPYRIVERVDDLAYVPALLVADEARERWGIPKQQGVRWKQKEAWAQSREVRAQWMLAVDRSRHLVGRATWYPDRLSKDTRFAAASNDYPLRTKLKVTNIYTNEFVVVTIQSVGPFVNGRIIDLTHSAFSKIGYPRKQGVITVAVESVHPLTR